MPINTPPFPEPDDEFEQWLNKIDKDLEKDLENEKEALSNDMITSLYEILFKVNETNKRVDVDHYNLFVNMMKKHIQNWGNCIFLLKEGKTQQLQNELYLTSTEIMNGVEDFEITRPAYEELRVLWEPKFSIYKSSPKGIELLSKIFKILFFDPVVPLPLGPGEFVIVPFTEKDISTLNPFLQLRDPNAFGKSPHLVFYNNIENISVSYLTYFWDELLRSPINLTDFFLELSERTQNETIKEYAKLLVDEEEVEKIPGNVGTVFSIITEKEALEPNVLDAMMSKVAILEIVNILADAIYENMMGSKYKIISKGTHLNKTFANSNICYPKYNATGVLFKLP